VLLTDALGYQGCSPSQWAQSPSACAGPQDPNAPYQGPDGQLPGNHTAKAKALGSCAEQDRRCTKGTMGKSESGKEDGLAVGGLVFKS
jgi:hypothetical protein